jgi:hypothetical protein
MNFLHTKSVELAPDYEPGSPVIELLSTAPVEMSDIQRVTLSVASDEPTSADKQATTAMPTVTDETVGEQKGSPNKCKLCEETTRAVEQEPAGEEKLDEQVMWKVMAETEQMASGQAGDEQLLEDNYTEMHMANEQAQLTSEGDKARRASGQTKDGRLELLAESELDVAGHTSKQVANGQTKDEQPLLLTESGLDVVETDNKAGSGLKKDEQMMESDEQIAERISEWMASETTRAEQLLEQMVGSAKVDEQVLDNLLAATAQVQNHEPNESHSK